REVRFVIVLAVVLTAVSSRPSGRGSCATTSLKKSCVVHHSKIGLPVSDLGSFASDQRSQRLRRMSAVPPIASKPWPCSETDGTGQKRTHAPLRIIRLVRSRSTLSDFTDVSEGQL